MSIRLYIEQGGEIYLPFARKKLAEMKAWMKQSGLVTFTKRYFISDSEHILINSLLLEYGQSLDIIRINFSSGYTDYVPMLMPNPVPYRGVTQDRTTLPGIFGTNYVMVSDGTILASEDWTYPTIDGFPHIKYGFISAWNGGGTAWLAEQWTGGKVFSHNLTFAVPEDCVYPTPQVATPGYLGTDGLSVQWGNDWQAGVTAFNTRRKAWFKKNSDEFIAALKYGFAATYKDTDGSTKAVPGVTRAELQTGSLPPLWDLYIKRNVGQMYQSYPPLVIPRVWTVDQPNWWLPEYEVWEPRYLGGGSVNVGRTTHRDILFEDLSLVPGAPSSDTVESDTSADLTQNGVKVTKRVIPLRYQVAGEATPRETTITGYLTQIVTEHVPYALTRNNLYDTWYYAEAHDPSGSWADFTLQTEKAAPFYEDRNYVPIGIVVNGVEQSGYGKDSLSPFGIGNPLTYIGYAPAYPQYSNTIVATAIPDYIDAWHRDSKIIYDKNGVGASPVQNDSAMYGVTEVHISPIAPYPEESLGMFGELAATYSITGGVTIFTPQQIAQQQLSGLEFTITGDLTSDATFIVPDIMNPFTVSNLTTGAFTVTFKTAGGAGKILVGYYNDLYANGKAIVAVPDIQITILLAQTAVVDESGKTVTTTTASISGVVFATVTDGVVELPTGDYFLFTGTLTVPVIFIMPDTSTPLRVEETTTGGFTVTLKTKDGAGVIIPRSSGPPILLVYSDGTDAKAFGTRLKIEIYGTAKYSFDWQTGALTFKSWKALHDAEGKEVATKTVDLPAGYTLGATNCIITYKGLHWDDVVVALKARDVALKRGVGDQVLYTLIQAVKGG